MINNLLYVCGAPGVGKSTAMRLLREQWDCDLMGHEAVPHVRLRHPLSGRPVGVELGVPRESFPGTDALSMSISPHALSFLSAAYYPFAMGEGARLATRPFVGGLASRGVRTTLVLLKADQELLDERWRQRGAKQNPSWRKGAATRATGLAQWFGAHLGQAGFYQLVEIDCTELRPEETADRIRSVFPLLDLTEAGVPARPAVAD